jgi:hypothetical protein
MTTMHTLELADCLQQLGIAPDTLPETLRVVVAPQSLSAEKARGQSNYCPMKNARRLPPACLPTS